MSLLKYILRRTLEAIPLLIGLVTLVFFLARLLPGDATDAYISPSIPPSAREELKSQLGVDRPILEQYVHWIRQVFSGDLGISFTRHAPVLDVIQEVFPNTLILGVTALVIEMVLGILLSLPVFLFQGRLVDTVLSNLMLVVYTLPSFWVGVMLLVVFSYGLGLLPSSQMYSSGEIGSLVDLSHHLVLPALTAAIPGAAGFARYLRTSIVSTMSEEYVLAARSMGLTKGRIFATYVLPNAISPLVSLVGVEIGVLLTGLLVTETLFSWPGMGLLTVNAIFSRDYPLILGCTLISGIVVIGGNILSDVVNAVFDPRIRFAE